VFNDNKLIGCLESELFMMWLSTC